MRRYLILIILVVLATAAAVYDGVLRFEKDRIRNVSDHLLERVYSRSMREFYTLLADARLVLEQGGGNYQLLTLQQSSPLSPFLDAADDPQLLAQPGDWQVRLGLEELNADISVKGNATGDSGLLLDLYSRYGKQHLYLRIDLQNWMAQTTDDLGLGMMPWRVNWRGHTLPPQAGGTNALMTLFSDFLVPEFSLYLSHEEIEGLFHARTEAVLMAALVAIPELLLLLWLWRQYFHGRSLERALERSNLDLRQQRHQNQLRSRMLQHASEQVKGLNQDLEHARKRMELSERLAALGEISAGIAHEINNPVAYSLSNIRTLSEDVSVLASFIRRLDEASDQLDPKSPFYLELAAAYRSLEVGDALASAPDRIKDATEGIERVGRIIQDMRKLSRGSNEDRTLADLSSHLTSVINIARSRLKGNIEFVTDLVELPPIYCNPSQVGQVVLNILVNAIQAIGNDRGCVTLTEFLHQHELEIRICDDGPGMNEAVAARVFEPFFTTKAEGEGTGMGLALCYQLIQAHEGRIDLKTKPGEGTCFSIWLPLNAQNAGAGDETHAE
ncbi:sensor histidine kinase [Thalassolituus sp. LLYu03]|uniref:sensor histidine kinase n=1 Tax=Thalassolituus sp. LLYu03 TaxID=3421656 RepID=UPI003D29FBDC